jgi:serine/threonine protein kinase
LQEKRQQILNEIRTLTEACCYPGFVEFQGVFYAPDSGEIYFALEYMDGGSLADIIRVKKFIPEPVLSHMLQKVLLVRVFYLNNSWCDLYSNQVYKMAYSGSD